jgi:hypothetical protein
LIAPLYKRKSPNLAMQVLSIEGHLLPGHSGAPLFDEDNKLIGVGNGGLQAGAIEVSWAIPWSEIEWQAVDKLSTDNEERYTKLQESSPLLFSFSVTSLTKEEIVTKTVCKSIFGLDYDTLNELKSDLLLTAKYQAVGELFGEFLMGYSESNNGTILEDQLLSSSIGYVRVAGNPVYSNHKTNLAEVCVAIQAFVTGRRPRKI